jgi:hypothetical protein
MRSLHQTSVFDQDSIGDSHEELYNISDREEDDFSAEGEMS